MLYFYLKSFFLLRGIGTNYKNFNVVATWGWYCAAFQSFSFFFFSSLHLYSFPVLFIIVLFRMLPEVFKAEGEVKTVSVVSCDSSQWLTLCQRSLPSRCAECSACVISRNSPSSPAGAALLLTALQARQLSTGAQDHNNPAPRSPAVRSSALAVEPEAGGPLWNVWHFTKGSCSEQWPFIGQKTEAHRNLGCMVGPWLVRLG